MAKKTQNKPKARKKAPIKDLPVKSLQPDVSRNVKGGIKPFLWDQPPAERR